MQVFSHIALGNIFGGVFGLREFIGFGEFLLDNVGNFKDLTLL